MRSEFRRVSRQPTSSNELRMHPHSSASNTIRLRHFSHSFPPAHSRPPFTSVCNPHSPLVFPFVPSSPPPIKTAHSPVVWSPSVAGFFVSLTIPQSAAVFLSPPLRVVRLLCSLRNLPPPRWYGTQTSSAPERREARAARVLPPPSSLP